MGTIKVIENFNRSTNTKETWRHITRTNEETGEIIETEEIETLEYGEERFLKLNTEMFFRIMFALSGNARLVLGFVFQKMSRGTNIALVKQKEVAENVGISKATAERCFVELQKADAIRMKEACQWMVNPELVTGCRKQYRQFLIREYFKLRPYEPRELPKSKGDEKN